MTCLFQHEMAAGACAGLCQISVTTPMDLLKIQMQDEGRVASQRKDSSKSSTISTVKKLLEEKGFIGLWKGLRATALRDVTFSVIFFPIFTNLNKIGPRSGADSKEVVSWWSFLVGSTAASISAFATTPFDVIKTRLQVDSYNAKQRDESLVSEK